MLGVELVEETAEIGTLSAPGVSCRSGSRPSLIGDLAQARDVAEHQARDRGPDRPQRQLEVDTAQAKACAGMLE
jgi:hypothetical protein